MARVAVLLSLRVIIQGRLRITIVEVQGLHQGSFAATHSRIGSRL